MAITIRAGTVDDVPWMDEQLVEFSKQVVGGARLYPGAEYSQKFMTAIVKDHFVRIAESQGQRAGFISGVVTNHPYNPKLKMLVEQFWWVSSLYRRGRAGAMLLDAFVEWGRGNVDWIGFGIEGTSPVKERFLGRRGFKLNSRSFLLEVRHV